MALNFRGSPIGNSIRGSYFRGCCRLKPHLLWLAVREFQGRIFVGEIFVVLTSTTKTTKLTATKFTQHAALYLRIVTLRSLNRTFCSFSINIIIPVCVVKHTIYAPRPPDSILLAVLTVSPNKQYLGILSPTTPATHGPVMCVSHKYCKYLHCSWDILSVKTTCIIARS